ncbi:MAG: DUF1707 domain-containing protein [Acidimicrobiales bacterium]|jgi:hypothetical protein
MPIRYQWAGSRELNQCGHQDSGTYELVAEAKFQIQLFAWGADVGLVEEVTVAGSTVGLRASDADRDQAIEVLNNALAIGQLAPEEHEERLQAALGAATVDALGKLTADLRVLPHQRSRWSGGRRRVAAAVVVVATGAAVTGVALSGSTSAIHPTNAASKVTSMTSDGFVQPEASVAGKFCRAMAVNHAQNPDSNPSGVTPVSDPWGQPVAVSPSAPPSAEEDLAAAQSLANATGVVEQAWRANGYQYKGLTVPCLGNYDSTFDFVSAEAASTGSTIVSSSFADRHSLLAVQSASGTCWYELNVMYRGDPIIQADNLQSYGTFFATASHSNCSADNAPGYGLWQFAGSIPPQLQTG